ncbi:hypothetical protein EYF80_008726 [Liparis tanakae]|uniref:Uncharacterized protein n=1 Tax=Liparis tanakae TaxID=230148 RepID=A0A4Z2ISV7_9TELE|nr:hypothetical protein EYF80_008726 [Liparis tanakae]
MAFVGDCVQQLRAGGEPQRNHQQNHGADLGLLRCHLPGLLHGEPGRLHDPGGVHRHSVWPLGQEVSASRGAVPTSEVWHGAQREHRKKHPLQLPRHAPVHGQIQPERGGGRHPEPQDRVGPPLHELVHSLTFTCSCTRTVY